MSIQLTYLNRAFHGLSIDMSHDPEHIFSVFGVVTPPQGGPPSKILSDYKNIGIYLCPCQKSASYLKKCGRAPPLLFVGVFLGWFWGFLPLGGPECSHLKNLSDYDNIGLNQCPCQKSAS